MGTRARDRIENDRDVKAADRYDTYDTHDPYDPVARPTTG